MTCIVGSISNTYFLWALINIIIFGTVGMRVHEYYSTVFFSNTKYFIRGILILLVLKH